MPEIAEVARIVHFLRNNLRNRKISSVLTQDDPIVYGKVGTSAAEFAAALKGRTVLDAQQQGKYFWLVMDKPPHPVMHFGMTGWIKMSNIETGYYKPKKSKGSDGKADVQGEQPEDQEWPPKFYKFVIKMEGGPDCEAAFTDARRLGRVRLVDAPGKELRNTTPLKENGPDPVIDKDILTEEWLTKKLRSKKSPVKAVLLDQANISGVGNWVGDEVLYNAKIHPEQYSNTLTDQQCKQLHKSLTYVCSLACELLGDSDLFPEDWLFKHRWNKGKKGENVLPNGHKIVHLTVGGRTSAVVPSVQKKTGPVAGDVDVEVNGASKEESDEGDTPSEEDAAKAKKSKAAKTKATTIPKSTGKRKAAAAEEKPASIKKAKNSPGAKKLNGAAESKGRRTPSRRAKT